LLPFLLADSLRSFSSSRIASNLFKHFFDRRASVGLHDRQVKSLIEIARKESTLDIVSMLERG
jgi:hypothetical protein